MDRVSTGAATVTLSGIREAVEAARAAVTSSTEREVRERLESILDGARARWPVRTGRSRAGLDLVRLGREALQQRIRNAVEYADDVRARGQRVTSWEDLVVRPVERSRLELELRLRGVLQREVQRAIGEP